MAKSNGGFKTGFVDMKKRLRSGFKEGEE